MDTGWPSLQSWELCVRSAELDVFPKRSERSEMLRGVSCPHMHSPSCISADPRVTDETRQGVTLLLAQCSCRTPLSCVSSPFSLAVNWFQICHIPKSSPVSQNLICVWAMRSPSPFPISDAVMGSRDGIGVMLSDTMSLILDKTVLSDSCGCTYMYVTCLQMCISP